MNFLVSSDLSASRIFLTTTLSLSPSRTARMFPYGLSEVAASTKIGSLAAFNPLSTAKLELIEIKSA